MVVPSAEFIERAQDEVKNLPPAMVADQMRELHEATGNVVSADLFTGFMLGLQTARAWIAGAINPRLL